MLFAREVEQRIAIGMKRRTVVEQQGGTRGEPGHQPVPHHPAAGGEIELPIARLDVTVELMLLQMLKQRATGAMDDAFGNARGARGIHDEQRVVEGQADEVNLAGGKCCDEIAQADRLGQ